MVCLRQDARGNYVARKRLPDDVKEEYKRQFGAGSEAKKTWPASTDRKLVERLFHEWLADVEARIAAIRAMQKGEGIPLTRLQARALAGEWYDWFIARHPDNDREHWELLRDQVYDALRDGVGEKRWEQCKEPELWRADEKLRKAVRPVLADVGETAQFLATKKIVPDNKARALFLDFLYADLAAALKRLLRMSEGHYGPDKYREQFPKFEGADTGETPVQLFKRWVTERKPKDSSIESWRYVFRKMEDDFKGRSAASISADEAQEWVSSLITPKRSAHTVHNTWIAASRRVFSWAKKRKYIPRNPFEDANVTLPRRTKLRETKAFSPHEYRPILKASLAIADTSKSMEAAKRWVPWLLAYTGARPVEITQLRKKDVTERDGIYALHLTPEAGSIKTDEARWVPMHEHLVAQGFLAFAQGCSDGPLFCTASKRTKSEDPTVVSKSRAAQVRQRLAAWVRSLGVADRAVRPNHGWRHTFKQIADRAGISERASDSITGHSPKSQGAAYGAPTLEDKAEAMKRFPRYALD